MRLTCFVLLLAFSAAAAEPPPRVEVGNRVSEGLPAELPAELTDLLGRYQNTRAALLGGFLGDGSLLTLTRFGETNQLHRVSAPLGMREQLTFFKEPVMFALASPRRADGFVYGRDEGGSEFWQLYWYDLAKRESVRLTDGKRSRNESPLFSQDGRRLAFTSTMRNGTDSDIWVSDLAGGSRAVLTEGGTWRALDFSPDQKRLLVLKTVSINEAYPGEVDLETGKLQLFPVDGGKAAFTTFRYAPDGRSVYFVSDEGREVLTLWHHDPEGGAPAALSTAPWDVTQLSVAEDGKHLAYVTNEDGISRLHLLSLPRHKVVRVGALPTGVITALSWAPDSRTLAVAVNSATSPSDLYTVAVKGGAVTRWTRSEVGGLDTSQFVAPELIRYPSFDKRSIPAFYYRPRTGKGPFPVIVNIHGGPEAQALPIFSPVAQFLVNELGVALLVPNVRGSAGYGKAYLQLDNGLLREDSVKDIGALLDYVATRPELDSQRVGVMGGSYGGYMVLASLVHYSERLRAGIDVVGISHFGTFLKNTESYRRDLRRVEYGDEREPEMAAFHEKISPLSNAARIKRPLFVAQGLNDPRVPASEAEQIVKAVRGNDVPVWYLLFKDEGHGFQKKTNADYFGAASMLFWQTHLLPPK